MRKRLIVGVAGASGSALALETLRQLAAADIETHLVISDCARATIAQELVLTASFGLPLLPSMCIKPAIWERPSSVDLSVPRA
jgi:3-polyprenyl-4-hydroxybenzoate decarboxylase